MSTFMTAALQLPRSIKFVFLTLIAVASQAHSQSSRWAEASLRDLEFIKAEIGQAHPGIIFKDEAFLNWYEQGYLQAKKLAASATNAREADAAIGFYTTGFMDGHLMSWRKSTTTEASWSGWMIQRRNGEFLVVENAPQWPEELPPVGSRVISCDGIPIIRYVEEYLAPYIERRLFLEAAWQRLLARVTLDSPAESPVWKETRAKKCLIETPDGKQKLFAQRWQTDDETQIRTGRAFAHNKYNQKLTHLGDGVYWVSASNFQPDKSEFIELNRMLEQLRNLHKAKAIILDTRNGSGGNAGMGMRILHAILKNNFPNDESETAAFYRISAFAISLYERGIKEYGVSLGTDSFEYRFLVKQLEAMREAQKKGIPTVTQLAIPEEDISEKGEPFSGKLLVVTDVWCASSCLDFIDAVRSVPDALHIGLPTSGDTNYMEAPSVKSPSGLSVSIPIKVFQGRPRGSNQPYEPHYRFNGDIQDTASLQEWSLKILHTSNQ